MKVFTNPKSTRMVIKSWMDRLFFGGGGGGSGGGLGDRFRSWPHLWCGVEPEADAAAEIGTCVKVEEPCGQRQYVARFKHAPA